jgi:hypothetical protein
MAIFEMKSGEPGSPEAGELSVIDGEGGTDI